MSDKSLWARNLVSDWNRCHGAFYQLRATDLTWQLEKQDWLEYSPAELAGIPLLLAEVSPKGAERGISRKTLWVSCQGEIPESKAGAFALALDRLAPARGKTRLCLGGEEFHLIPGIPNPPDDGGLNRIAENLGFKLTEAVDYCGNIRNPDLTAYVESAMSSAANWGLEEVVSEAGLDELDAYMQKEFTGRWTREFRFWRERSDTRRAFWNVLREGGGEIRGFARLALRGENEGGWIPGALRFPLSAGSVDSPRDASLGPIGISAAERGRGAGKILLALSLQTLLRKNAEQLCIDWTNAYNYYKPLGLSVVRRYRSALKDY